MKRGAASTREGVAGGVLRKREGVAGGAVWLRQRQVCAIATVWYLMAVAPLGRQAALHGDGEAQTQSQLSLSPRSCGPTDGQAAASLRE